MYWHLKDQSVNSVLCKNLMESTGYLTLNLAVCLLTTGFEEVNVPMAYWCIDTTAFFTSTDMSYRDFSVVLVYSV